MLSKRWTSIVLLLSTLLLTIGNLSAQTCTVTDYLYLNDVTSSGGYVHKLRLNAGISATEIYSSGTKPWFPAGGILDTPHGLGQDLNGNLYIGQTGDGPIAKIRCNGTVVNPSFINDGGFNIVSKDGYLYIDDNGTNRINRYSLCDGSAQGYIILNGDFSYGSETMKDWGMEIDADGTFYVTAGFNVLNNNKNTYIYRFKPTAANFTAHTAYTAQLITGVGTSLKPGTGDNGISNTNEVWGITHDPAGNMYVVVRDRNDDTNKETWILKYDKNFNLVNYIMEKDDSPTGGIEGARGIVYYAPWDRLLIAGGPDGDCVAKVRPSDMAYTGALAPNEPGQTPKTLRIASEACPTAASLTVDTTMCGVQVGDKVFLQNIIGTCKAPICGGTWTASSGNAGITFNQCDLSFTVTNVAIGCGKFTLTNVGGTCGDFTITVNVDFADVTAPVIAGNQTVCGTLAPTPFTVTTAATTSGTKPIKYQWQKSTTSCTAGFSNIAGATSSTYAAAAVTKTTYYRVFVIVDGSCTTPKGSCADTSNCVTVSYVNTGLNITATPGACLAATNKYSVSGVVSLTNALAGTAKITDGTSTTTVAVAAGATSIAYTLTGLPSDGLTHTVSVSTACGTDVVTYTAPASCSVAPCALNVVVTPGSCNSATNQYSVSGTVSLTSAVAGTMTVTDGSATTTVAVAANQTSVSYTLSGLISTGASHTVVATLPGCGSDFTTYTAPASCTVCTVNLTTSTLPNGQVGTAYSRTLVTTGGTAPYTYTISTGTLPAGLSLNPTTGVISGTPTAATTSNFTIKVTDSKSCTDVAALSITTSAAPVCSLTATATPGTCTSATNQYTVTGTISATSTTGTQSLTISVGTIRTTVNMTGNGPVSFTLAGLTSDGLKKTVSVVSSATACGSASVTYTAPASCSVAPCALNVVVSPGSCNSATNQYSVSGTVSLTSAVAGTLTITDGPLSATVAIGASVTSVSYTLSGLISNGASHTVVAALPGCGSDKATYLAPASCTVCTANLTTANLPNGQVGTAYSRTLVTSGGTAPYTYTVATGTLPAGLNLNPTTGVISGTPTAATTSVFTIKVTDAKSCTDVQSFTIVTSALPVCSLDLIVTPGTCNSVTNQYGIAGTVTLTNPTAGNLVITDGTKSTTLTITASTTSVAYSLTGLTSGSGSHTVVASLAGCGTDNAAYTAPASCTVAPCALNVVVSPGTCNSATNQYSIAGTVSLTSAVAGTLTITDGSATTTVAVSANQTSVSYALSGLTSNGASHTVVATLPGCGSDKATYLAPASCTVCTANLTTANLPNGQVGTAYSRTLVTTGGTAPYTYTVATGTLPAGLNLNPTTGVISGTPTAAATRVFTIKVTDARSCTDVASLTIVTSALPACAVDLVATPGTCNPTTNRYTTSGTVTLTNPVAGNLVISDGSSSTTVAVTTSTTTVAFTLAGLTSGTGSHTIVASLAGCGSDNVVYTAPVSCTVAPCALNVVVTPGSCNSATNQYSVSGTVSLTSAVAGTLTITDGVKSTTVTITTAMTSVAYSLSGLTSGSGSHTVVATLPGCGSDNATYAAPASCTVCTVNLTTSTLPNGQVGTAYSQTLTTTGGTTPYTYTVSTGSLPAGLSLNPTTGVISGTPTAATTSNFTIKVTDSKSCTDVAALSITTSAAPVCSLTVTATPGACNVNNNNYRVTGTISATNTTGNQTLTISVGSVTTTATMVGNGPVSYTLIALPSDGLAKTVSVTSSATACGSASVTYTAPVSCSTIPPALAISISTPICNSATNTYTATSTVSFTNTSSGIMTVTDNGATIGTISVTVGQTTATLSVSGVSNASNHTLTATLNGLTASTTYAAPASCTVCTLGLTSTSLASGKVGVPYSQTITATGGTAPYTFSVAAGKLPNGLSLNATTGVVAGTPTTTGSYQITVVVTDKRGCLIKVPFSVINIGLGNPAISIIVNSPVCTSATNTYVATGTVSLTNSPAGSLTITDNGNPVAVIVVTEGQTSASFSLTGISNGPTVQLVSAALGTLTASTTYTTPASCTAGAPDYVLAKLVDQNRVEKGGIVTYTVSLTNIGNATGTNIVVGDQLSNTDITFVGSATASTGTFVPGGNSGSWTIASLAAGQVATLRFKVQLNQEGITYNTATSPTGQTATVCTTVPFKVCANEAFEFTLSVAPGQSGYQWSRNGQPIAGATTNTLSVTALGEYTVATTGSASCSTGACCPFVIEAYGPLPSLTAVVTAATCIGATPLDNATISLVASSTNAVSYNISLGDSFIDTATLFTTNQSLATVVGGVLTTGLPNPVAAPGQAYTIRVYSQDGCYADTTVTIPPAQCICPRPVCVPVTVRKLR